MANKKKPLKKQKIRNSEYYDMQSVFDELYADSVKGKRFQNLVELIQRPENIMLAYRNIRKNDGSKTAGVDNKTISDLNRWKDKTLVAYGPVAKRTHKRKSQLAPKRGWLVQTFALKLNCDNNKNARPV